MPSHDYRCPEGHVTDRDFKFSDDVPADVLCGALVPDGPCNERAVRVWQPWAATHYKGPGTYTTDYKSKYDRKRRRNPGDSLPLPSEAVIGRAEGAEYDPPKNLPASIKRAA